MKCNGGSGLLRDLPQIKVIFEAVRKAVTIPFTVKFRAGWNEKELVFLELAKLAEDCGLNAVAMHARTREQGYSGQANWNWIADLKQMVKIPVIGNGDIRNAGRCCRHGGAHRLRCRDDRPYRGFESLDFPPDRAVHRRRVATICRRTRTATT